MKNDWSIKALLGHLKPKEATEPYLPPNTAEYKTPIEAITEFLQRSVTPQTEEAIVDALIRVDIPIFKKYSDQRQRAGNIRRSINFWIMRGRLLRSKNGLVSLND